ncbi:MAG: PHA/PHB synthase family protein [Chromatiales bacterium]
MDAAASTERSAPPPARMWQRLMGYQCARDWIEWQRQVWAEHPLAKLIPLDTAEVSRAWIDLAELLAAQPALAEKHLSTLLYEQSRLALWTWRRLQGDAAEEPIPASVKDHRFQDPDWSQLLPFSTLRQWYLLWSKWISHATEEAGSGNVDTQRIAFYLRQWLDALCPANFPVTNPVVMRETLASGGENLKRGLKNLAEDLERGAISVVPGERFRPGENLALTPGDVVYRNELMELMQYRPATKKTYAVPLLIIPPWINRYYVLDMRPGMSMVEHLVAKGFAVFLISWRNPDKSQASLGFEDYLRLGPLEALKVIKGITRSRKVNLAGYCIGGTLLGIALAYLAARRDFTAGSATFLTSLLDFAEVGETALFLSEQQLAEIERRMNAKGYLSPDEVSSIFRLMRSNDLIWNFVVNNYLLGKEPPSFDLMHWSVDGTRLPRAMHEYYLYNMYLRNNLSKPDALEMLGKKINLGRVRCPAYIVAGSEDHIVPWRAAFRTTTLLSGPARFVLGNAGHITSIVSPPGPGKAAYLTGKVDTGDADGWQQAATRYTGSWWSDWVKWLARHSGENTALTPRGSRRYPPIEPAPGRYVLET